MKIEWNEPGWFFEFNVDFMLISPEEILNHQIILCSVIFFFHSPNGSLYSYSFSLARLFWYQKKNPNWNPIQFTSFSIWRRLKIRFFWVKIRGKKRKYTKMRLMFHSFTSMNGSFILVWFEFQWTEWKHNVFEIRHFIDFRPFILQQHNQNKWKIQILQTIDFRHILFRLFVYFISEKWCWKQVFTLKADAVYPL